MDDEEDLGPTPDEVRAAALYRESLRDLMKQAAFRDFVWRQLKRCGIYQDGFSDSHAAASFMSGKRNVGLAILGDLLSADPLAYVKMQQENNHE